MSNTFAKLQYKGQERILVVDAPEEFEPHLEEVPTSVIVDRQPEPNVKYDFVLVFVTSRLSVARHATRVPDHLNPDALLWMAYPKKTSKKYKADLSRDDGWQPFGELSFEGVRMIAIDEDWSALRLRQAGFIKKNR